MASRYVYRVEFSSHAQREALALDIALADLEAAARERIDDQRYAGTPYECAPQDNGFDSFVFRDRVFVCLFPRDRTVLVDAVVEVGTVRAALPDLFEDAGEEDEFGFPVPATSVR
jgi:hypothetical protein